MAKVLMIGIDGCDSNVVSKFEKSLPNLRKLRERGCHIRPISVYPPDSDTAWATIYTGLDPAKHGIVHFVDPLEKVARMVSQEIDNSFLKGRTFWDIAGESGKKVCMVFPHLAYPGWQLNGVLVARSAVHNDVRVYPESASEEADLSHLNTDKGFPGREEAFESYIQRSKKLARDEVQFGLKLLRKGPWDLFFIYSSVLDSVQHHFWNLCDASDPSYPGQNPYQSVIQELYQLFDWFVGEFIAAVDGETTVIVLSDHGHGMRPTKLLNINELLRENGFLFAKEGGAVSTGLIRGSETLRRGLVDLVVKHHLGNLARVGLRFFPPIKKLYTVPRSIDWSRTLCYVSDLSGIKAYSYGGLIIRKENLGGADYETMREKIVQLLSGVKEPDSGERAFEWIRRPQELYSGPFLGKYPDLVFQLKDGLGAGWAVHDALFSVASYHNLVPGSHRADTPVFLMADPHRRQPTRQEMTLMDVAPTVLDLLGVEGAFDFDGQSIFSAGVSSRPAQGAGSA